MSLKISVFFILLSLVQYSNDTQLDRILTHPDKVVYGDEGSNVSFVWDFHIGSWPNPRPKVVKFVFGEWAFPGYVRKKLLYVQGHNQVNKRRGFVKKVDWRGNIYKCVNCTAVVVMYNLTRADFKSYGVYIELGVDRSPLTNWLRLVIRATQQYLDRILTHPDEVVYRDEGSNVSFEWNFHIGSWPNPQPKVVEFVFGEWARPGYVRKKILYVRGHNQVDKRRGFVKKVDWMGNIYKCVECTAAVVMYNLTRADFKSYGVYIELGVDRRRLTNWLRLVKIEPASITKWPQNIAVQEGNSTTIECRASGLPPPSVKIKRNNQTLQTCNNTKPCVYKIQAARSEDQGEYVCLVQQGNSSVIISRSLNLTVLKTRKTWAAKIIAADLAPNETIRGIYGERLDILCPLHFPNIAEQQIILYINSQPMIIMEFKKNKTPAIHCTSDHPYEKMCQTQMMNSYADKNNVHFTIDKVPETLNGSTSECGTDHDDFEKKTRRDPPRTIILRDPSTIISTASKPNKDTKTTFSDTTTAATTTYPPSTENTTTAATTTYPPSTESPKKNGLSTGAKIGIICAAISVFFIVSIWVMISKRPRRQQGSTYALL